MAASTNPFLLLLILLPSSIINASEPEPSSKQEYTINPHILLSRFCSGLEDQDSCFMNMSRELGNLGLPNSVSVLRAALTTTLGKTREAVSMVSRFTALSVDFREQVAIEDCKELLDFSVSELAWSLGEMKRIRDGDRNVHYEGNLKAWLSAALSNQDTCLDGFDGTDGRVRTFISGSLKQVNQLISNVLSLYTQLHSLPFKPPRKNKLVNNTKTTDFPDWMDEADRGLMDFSPAEMKADAVVALDGSGDFRTIGEAVTAAPSYSSRRYVIYVKEGIYKENIDLKRKKSNIMFVGDGIGKTVVTGNRNFMQGWTTFRTASVAVSGRGFIARDMTFRNTAGPVNHQAVALRVDSDQSAFYRCSMESHQDTLYAHSLRQFYRECEIYGTIDFIFGNGAAVLQNCKIYSRVPLPLQKVTITAQGRKSPDQSTGFTIQDSYVLASRPTYLGRPWKQYSRTVFINTYMSDQVQPRGWLEWFGDFALGTLWYGEYRNYGPGASLTGRVKWPGYHIIKDASTAEFFTAGRFIDGRSWLPSTGVKFTAGLSN